MSESEFFNQLKKGVNVVEFWSPDCSPCKIVTPALEEIKYELGNAFNLILVNSTEHPEIAFKMRVLGLPTVLIFKDGEPVDVLYMTYPQSVYRERIEKHIHT